MTVLTSLWVLASETHSNWVIHVPSSLETRLSSETYTSAKGVKCVSQNYHLLLTVFALQTAEDEYEVRVWRDGRLGTQIVTENCVTETVGDLYTQSTALGL